MTYFVAKPKRFIQPRCGYEHTGRIALVSWKITVGYFPRLPMCFPFHAGVRLVGHDNILSIMIWKMVYYAWYTVRGWLPDVVWPNNFTAVFPTFSFPVNLVRGPVRGWVVSIVVPDLFIAGFNEQYVCVCFREGGCVFWVVCRGLFVLLCLLARIHYLSYEFFWLFCWWRNRVAFIPILNFRIKCITQGWESHYIEPRVSCLSTLSKPIIRSKFHLSLRFFFFSKTMLFAHNGHHTHTAHRTNTKLGAAQAEVWRDKPVKDQVQRKYKWARSSQSKTGTPKPTCATWRILGHDELFPIHTLRVVRWKALVIPPHNVAQRFSKIKNSFFVELSFADRLCSTKKRW